MLTLGNKNESCGDENSKKYYDLKKAKFLIL